MHPDGKQHPLDIIGKDSDLVMEKHNKCRFNHNISWNRNYNAICKTEIFLSRKMRKKEETDLAISIGLTDTHKHALSTLKIMNQHYLKD